MHRIALRSLSALAAAAAAFALAAPAFAQEHGGSAAGSTRAIEPVVIWSFSGILAGALLLGVFYLLKRRVGGFPKNPSWVAPITIMPSKDFPGDTDPHEGGHEPDLHHTPAHH